MTGRRRSLMVLAGVTALPLVAVGCGSVSRGAYIEANERLFTALPSFPKAQVRSETSTAYRSRESGPVVGYGTRFDLQLPATATRAAVSSFFRERPQPQWRLLETLDGSVFNFRRGTALVSVNLGNAHVHAFEIAVDHAYYGKVGR